MDLMVYVTYHIYKDIAAILNYYHISFSHNFPLIEATAFCAISEVLIQAIGKIMPNFI